MRHAVFVDTTAWFAITDATDTDHDRAVGTIRRLSEEGWTLVTTSQVVSETFTLMRARRLGVQAALTFLDTIRGTPSIRRVPIPADWEVAAEELLAQYDDQDFSYVDATSFVAMRRLRLTTAFAFDHHFVIAGFELFGASG